MNSILHLPVGVSNFRDLIKNKDPQQKGYLYIDKTNFIKEIIYDLTPVIVLTRPRRFGKTLNLSMLRHFFAAQVEELPTKGLFDGLNISKDSICMQHQGKYPVIFLSFKDVKQSNFEFCLKKIKNVVADTYRSYRTELS
ncbi:MAG: AAA family ATPase, partial [Gammaproteobacteria bacterium]